jgi:hypothetical protein
MDIFRKQTIQVSLRASKIEMGGRKSRGGRVLLKTRADPKKTKQKNPARPPGTNFTREPRGGQSGLLVL